MIDNEARTIGIEDIDQRSFLMRYQELQRQLKPGLRTEILFNAEGQFTGHNRVWNCWYSIHELRMNKEYKPDSSFSSILP